MMSDLSSSDELMKLKTLRLKPAKMFIGLQNQADLELGEIKHGEKKFYSRILALFVQ
jgi:hypothetical protein